MAADGTLLLALVEEYVSGLQDSKAKDTAAGNRALAALTPTTRCHSSSLRQGAVKLP